MPLPIAIVRPVEGAAVGVCEYANEAMQKLFAVPRDTPPEAALRTAGELLLDSNVADYVAICAQRGTSHRFSVVWHGDDPSEQTCLATVGPVPEGKVAVLIEVASSSTEGAIAAEDLWRALAENPTDYFVVMERDGTFLYINQTGRGIRMEDVVGRGKIYDYTVESDHATIREALAAAFDLGRVTTWESYVPLVDQWFTNVLRPVSRAGKPYAACLTSTQITAQKLAEIALRQSEAQLRSIAENAPDHISLADLDRRVLYLNYGLPGTRLEDVVGKMLDELWPASRRRELAALFEEVKATGTPRSYRLEVATPDGARIVQSRVGAVKEDDSVVGFVIVSSDVTEQIKLEEEMVHASRMATLGELAAGVGHEINNPLMLIRSISELVRDQLEPGPVRDQTIASYLDRLEQAVDRIARIVSGLRGLALRREAAEPFSVNQAVEGALSFIGGLFEFHRLDLMLELRARRDRVLGDEAGLQQVVLNLLSNARHAVAECAEPRVEIVTFNQKDSVVVEVRDNGPGVPEALLPTLFEAFSTTRGSQGGTGLGLAVSRTIVEAMEGELSVASRPGFGATFRVCLPLTARKLRPPRTERGASGVKLGGSLLLVDDEQMILTVMKLTLEKLGFDVTTAMRGAVALELLRVQRFDYLITDRQMPDITGEELIARAGELLDGTECFMLSGWFKPGEETGSVNRIGGHDVRLISKPVDRGELARLLAKSA